VWPVDRSCFSMIPHVIESLCDFMTEMFVLDIILSVQRIFIHILIVDHFEPITWLIPSRVYNVSNYL